MSDLTTLDPCLQIHLDACQLLKNKFNDAVRDCEILRNTNFMLRDELNDARKSEQNAIAELNRARCSNLESQKIISKLFSVKNEIKELRADNQNLSKLLNESKTKNEKLNKIIEEEQAVHEQQILDSNKKLELQVEKSNLALEVLQSNYAIQLNELENQINHQRRLRTEEVNSLLVEYESKIVVLNNQIKSLQQGSEEQLKHIEQYTKKISILERKLKLAEQTKLALLSSLVTKDKTSLQENTETYSEPGELNAVEYTESVDTEKIQPTLPEGSEYFYVVPNKNFLPQSRPIHEKFNDLLIKEKPANKKFTYQKINKSPLESGPIFNEGNIYNYSMAPKKKFLSKSKITQATQARFNEDSFKPSSTTTINSEVATKISIQSKKDNFSVSIRNSTLLNEEGNRIESAKKKRKLYSHKDEDLNFEASQDSKHPSSKKTR